MSQESRRLLKFAGTAWMATFLVACATVWARATLGVHSSNNLLAVCVFSTLVPGFELKRGWLGFGVVLMAGASALFIALAAGHFFTTLGLPHDRWLAGLVMNSVEGSICLCATVGLWWWFARKNADDATLPMPRSARALLDNWDEYRRRHERELSRLRVQKSIFAVAMAVLFGLTTGLGLRKELALPWWTLVPICILLIGGLAWAALTLGEKIGNSLTRDIRAQIGDVETRHQRLRAEIERIAASEEGRDEAKN